MTTDTQQQRAGDTRPSAHYVSEVLRGSTSLLMAAWLLLAEGALALIFLPVIIFTSDVQIPPGDIASFGLLGVFLLVGGTLLYSRWAATWWIALASALAAAAWLVADKGLTSWAEVFIGVGLAIAQVLFLILGRRAAGKPDSLALASARIPFRLKVTLVWLATFAMIGLFLALSDLDAAWMGENARLHRVRTRVHDRPGDRRDRAGGPHGLVRSARPACRRTRSRTASRASTPRSSGGRR